MAQTTRPASLFSTSAGKAVSMISEEAKQSVAMLFSLDANHPPATATTQSTPLPRDRQRSAIITTSTPSGYARSFSPASAQHIDATTKRNAVPATPTPQHKISRTLLGTPARTGLGRPNLHINGPLATPNRMSPLANRRVPGLGMTSRTTPASKRKAFATPFKPGYSATSTPTKPMINFTSPLRGPSKATPATKSLHTVFDMGSTS
jgi:hypothetical protein